eukprot:gene18710-biopygen3960
MQRRRRCQEQEHTNPPYSVLFCAVLPCSVLSCPVLYCQRKKRMGNGAEGGHSGGGFEEPARGSPEDFPSGLKVQKSVPKKRRNWRRRRPRKECDMAPQAPEMTKTAPQAPGNFEN